MGCLAATPADVHLSTGEGLEDIGQKAAVVGGDATGESNGEALVPTGFKVLGGFENKPVQKVHFKLLFLLLIDSKAVPILTGSKSFLFVC